MMSNAFVFFFVFFLLCVREGLRVKPENDAPVSKALFRFSRWVYRKFRFILCKDMSEKKRSSDGP